MTTLHQADDIIKNPNRDRMKDSTSYTPEYKRLGLNPILQDFSSLDGELLDTSTETSVVESHILDNNEEVSYGFGMKMPKVKDSASPDVGEFVLMITGKVIAHGSHEYILSEAKSILYREHPDYLEKKTALEDVVILKRIGLKIGVFLDE